LVRQGEVVVESGHGAARLCLGICGQVRDLLHEPVHEVSSGDVPAGGDGPPWLLPVRHLPHDQLHRLPHVPGLAHAAEFTLPF